MSIAADKRRRYADTGDWDISVRRRCELLGVNRSGLYYQALGESEYNIMLMNKLDKLYTARPFYGVRKMTEFLQISGHEVNVKRVRRLLRRMGLMAIYPRPCLSKACGGHKVYPYLLRDVAVTECDQVWSTDITYIRLKRGFVYLTAVIDWFSRYVLSWRLSNSLDAGFCIEALHESLEYGKCGIFNTDQGSQYTGAGFTGVLKDNGIRISMDGRGRALDNVFVERLWRSVKYEDIYLKDYVDVKSVRDGLKDYFEFYNHERIHQSLGYKTPAQVYLA